MYPPVNNFWSRAPETGSFLSQLLFHAGSDKFGIRKLTKWYIVLYVTDFSFFLHFIVLTPKAASSRPRGFAFSAYRVFNKYKKCLVVEKI